MTAIAAVLALSSTPLAAQEATSTDVPLVTVPAPEPVAPVADPLAPAPEASAPAETPAAAETVAAEPAEATPAAKSVARKAAAKAERTPARAATKATAPAAAPTAAPATEAVLPAPTPAAEAAPATAPELAPVEQAKGPKIDEAIPLAGGAGAVILALAGAGMAMRRRKRHDEEDGEYQDEMLLTDEVAPEPEPVWDPPVVQPSIAPMAATRTEVREGFDTSQFGRHVQAAYAGPTPENPSLSLRKRLKLAGELDRRERARGTASKSETPVTAKPEQKPAGFILSGTATQARTPEYQF